MGILLKIVYRNLKEHKVKTLIIGTILTFGIFILVVGNAAIDTVTAGITRNFIDNFTGHVAIFPSVLEEPSLGGEPGGGMDEATVPTITDFPAVLEFVQSVPRVVATSPQISGMASLEFGEEGSGFAQLLAVDSELYLEFFPDNIELIEGSFLKPGQEGIVLSSTAVEMLEDSSGDEVHVGDSILLTSVSQVTGMKIREVEVVGIYDVSVAIQAMTSYIDGENMRVLNGMTRITDFEAVLTEDEQEGLGAINEDSLFGGESTSLVAEVIDGNARGSATDEGYLSVIGDTSERELYNAVDPDSWHYLLVKLEDESQIKRTVAELNAGFEDLGLEVKAYPWLDAAGGVAEMTTALRTVFNAIVLVIAVVAIIIIMNTLVISVTERIAEIGTMRAIGAQKRFVRRMIIFETLVIALFFGSIGIILGGAAIAIVGAAKIEATNMIVQMLVGGSVLRPVVSAGSVLISMAGMVVAVVLASLYPATLALRIEPRQAMAS